MGRKMVWLFLALMVSLGATNLSVSSEALSAEKLKLGTAIKTFPPYYLVMLTAEEKGLWKEMGLDVEWVPFRGSVPLHQAIAARSLFMGMDMGASIIQANSRGLPLVMVQHLVSYQPFYIWVRPGGKIKSVKGLGGAKVGLSRLGSPGEAYARVVLKSLGLEQKVRFVGTGGVPAMGGALKAGAVDAVVTGMGPMIKWKVKGDAKVILNMLDYLPKKWLFPVVFTEKNFMTAQPKKVGKVVKAVLKSVSFILSNPRWAIEKMKSFQGYSDSTAMMHRNSFRFSRDGKISPEALANVRDILIKYRVISNKTTPPPNDLFTNRFTD